MSFILILDERISILNIELQKIRNERVKKDFYINSVSQQINRSINQLAEKNPSDHMSVLRETLSSVPEFISQSFKNIETLEVNVLTRISECENIKNYLVAHDNKIKQEKQLKKDKAKEKRDAKKGKSKNVSSRGRKPGERPEKERSPGERPEDKLKNRKKDFK
jgi:hypothetical protein